MRPLKVVHRSSAQRPRRKAFALLRILGWSLFAVGLFLGCAIGSDDEAPKPHKDGGVTDSSASKNDTGISVPDGGGCKPQTCEELGKNCGPVSDGCGNLIPCGTCTPPEICGGGNEPSVCGTAPCTKTTCEELGATCGPQG